MSAEEVKKPSRGGKRAGAGRPVEDKVKIQAYVQTETSKKIDSLKTEWKCKTVGEVIDRLTKNETGNISPNH